MQEIIHGPPCSGKTTVVQELQRLNTGLAYISVGVISRKEIKEQTALGREMEKLNKVGPYPQGLIRDLMEKHIKIYKYGDFILDGYPKHLGEVKDVTDIFRVHSICLSGIVQLMTDLETSISRGKSRLICDQCQQITSAQMSLEKTCSVCGLELHTRSEDMPEVISRRYSHYYQYTLPAIDMLRPFNSGFNQTFSNCSPREIALNICELEQSQQ